MPYSTTERETASDCLAAAIQAVLTARARVSPRPALRTELDRLISILADLRRALLSNSDEPEANRARRTILVDQSLSAEHRVTLVATPEGVRAECLCDWASPVQRAQRGPEKQRAWIATKEAGWRTYNAPRG